MLFYFQHLLWVLIRAEEKRREEEEERRFEPCKSKDT